MTRQLRADRAKLIEDMRALNTKSESEKRDLDPTEKVNFEKMRTDAIALKERYERIEATDELAKELGESRGAKVDPTKGRSAIVDPSDKTLTPEYKRAVNHYLRTGDLTQYRDLNLGTQADGGVTIPTDVTTSVVLALNRGSVMRKAGASVLATGSNTNIPISSTVTSTWGTEVSAFGGGSDTDPTMSVFNALAFRLTVGTKISTALLDDSAVDIQAFITERFVDTLAQVSDDAYVAGAGTTQPTGLLLGATTKVVASNTKFTAAELMANYFAVPSQYRSDKSFATIANDVTIGNIAAMAQSLTAPIVPFSYSLVPGEPDKLFGKPFFSSAAMPITYDASAKVLVMAAMKYYQIVDRIKQMSILRLNELYAGTYQVGFMSGFRTDGKFLIPDAGRILTLGTA